MDSWREPLLRGDALEEGGELMLLGLSEGGEEGLVVLAGDAADGFEHGATAFREVEGMAAAVVGIGAALDEALRFELIDQGDQTAGQHAEGGGEGLLGDRRGRAQDAQDSGVGRG